MIKILLKKGSCFMYRGLFYCLYLFCVYHYLPIQVLVNAVYFNHHEVIAPNKISGNRINHRYLVLFILKQNQRIVLQSINTLSCVKNLLK